MSNGKVDEICIRRVACKRDNKTAITTQLFRYSDFRRVLNRLWEGYREPGRLSRACKAVNVDELHYETGTCRGSLSPTDKHRLTVGCRVTLDACFCCYAEGV